MCHNDSQIDSVIKTNITILFKKYIIMKRTLTEGKNTRLWEDQDKDLKKMATKESIPKSILIRKAIDEFIKKRSKK